MAGGRGQRAAGPALIRRLIERVRRCAVRRPLLVCTDGLVSISGRFGRLFAIPCTRARGGRPRLRPWRNVLIAQVVKRYERRRVVATERRIIDGLAHVETLRRRSQGDGVINTAYIERLNATFRERLAPLARRCQALARHPDAARGHVLGELIYLLHAAYEFVSDTEDDAGHGGRNHGPWLDDARTVVVSCAAVALGTTEAAWTSCTGTATPDRALVFVTTVNCGATRGPAGNFLFTYPMRKSMFRKDRCAQVFGQPPREYDRTMARRTKMPQLG